MPIARALQFSTAEHAYIFLDLDREVLKVCTSVEMVKSGCIASDGTKLNANASVRQTRGRDGIDGR